MSKMFMDITVLVLDDFLTTPIDAATAHQLLWAVSNFVDG